MTKYHIFKYDCHSSDRFVAVRRVFGRDRINGRSAVRDHCFSRRRQPSASLGERWQRPAGPSPHARGVGIHRGEG